MEDEDEDEEDDDEMSDNYMTHAEVPKEKKIPQGVILDLLDMYDLEIEVLYLVVEYSSRSYKLNYRFKELKDEMFSLLEKWQIRGWEKIEFDKRDRIKGTFYLPFSNHDLVFEYQHKGLIPDLLQGKVEGYESELTYYPEEILEKMHATRKLIKRLLNSEFVDEDNTKRNEDIKDIIDGTKRVVADVLEEEKQRRNPSPQTKPKTRLEGRQITFDDELPAIIVDGKQYQLPGFTMTHYLARVMFAYRINEAIDWEQIEERMATEEGRAVDEGMLPEKRRKRLWDAADRLNERIRELLDTDDSLVEFKGLTIRRIY